MGNIPFENKKAVMEQMGDFGIQTDLNPQMMEDMSTWQEGMFYQQVVSGTLTLLTGIQNEVLNAEFKCLKTIKKNMK